MPEYEGMRFFFAVALKVGAVPLVFENEVVQFILFSQCQVS